MKIKYLLYRLHWHLAKFINFKSPVHLDIEINNDCNQKCIMCWHSLKKLPFKISKMSAWQVMVLLRDAKRSGVKSIKFNLRGEPLICDDLIDYIKLAKKLGFADIMINTNGILIKKRFKDLMNAGLSTCIISVDSFNEKSYCKIHNCLKSHFEILMKNLYYLKGMYEKGELKTVVKFNYHINKFNENDSLDIYEKDFKMFSMNKKYTMPRKGSDISVVKVKKERLKMCPHLMRRLTILADGKAYPCCVCYDEPKDILLGSIWRQAISGIWNSKERRDIKKQYKKGLYSKTCKQCTSKDIYK